MSFDVQKVRDQFPILAREIHGKPLAYLDNAASAQKPLAVTDAMKECYRAFLCQCPSWTTHNGQ